jgi:hypothetical protein
MFFFIRCTSLSFLFSSRNRYFLGGNSLPSEEEELEFVKAFREFMRLKNMFTTFADFSFEDYKSKYLDLYDKVKTSTVGK